jgi:hypothetical protein
VKGRPYQIRVSSGYHNATHARTSSTPSPRNDCQDAEHERAEPFVAQRDPAVLQIAKATVAVPLDRLPHSRVDVGGDLVLGELDRGLDVADGPGRDHVRDELLDAGDQVGRTTELVKRRRPEEVLATIELHGDVMHEDLDAGTLRLASGSERDGHPSLTLVTILVTVPVRNHVRSVIRRAAG